MITAGATEESALSWERLMKHSRYGRYSDEVESDAVYLAMGMYPSPGTLLDVGCEGGRWAERFANRGWQVIATDTRRESLSVCQSRIPQARCIQVDSSDRRLPVDNRCVDLVLCLEVGPVVHTDWAVQEFARVLKPGGRMVGVCWNRCSWRGLLYHQIPGFRIKGADPMIGYPITYSFFRSNMRLHGFTFEKEWGYAWGPFRRNSNSRAVDLWARIEKWSGLRKLIYLSPMVVFVAQKS